MPGTLPETCPNRGLTQHHTQFSFFLACSYTKAKSLQDCWQFLDFFHFSLMQLLILFSKQSFTQMTHYYTPIRNLTDMPRFHAEPLTVHARDPVPSSLISFIVSSLLQEARDQTAGCFLGLQHTLVTPLKQMCLTLPSPQTVPPFTLPTCPNKEVTYQH